MRFYSRVLLVGDLLCAAVVFSGVELTRLRLGAYIPAYDLVFGAALTIFWPAVVAIGGGYRRRAHGEGTEEFRSVMQAGLGLTAAVAIMAYLTQTNVARSYVMAMLPLTTVVTLLFRHRMRKRLHRLRSKGEHMRRVVAVGHRQSVQELVQQLRRQPYHGMRVVAACLPYGEYKRHRSDVDGVPVLGDFRDVPAVVDKVDAEAVAVLACPELHGAALRRLAWGIESRGTDLFVAPALMDVAGPRISVRPVAGMPLLHVEHPELQGSRRLVKSAFDKVVAAVFLLILAIPMLVIAVVVRATSPGPALFRQTRVGRYGREFHMLKFRTMVVDAERLKPVLLECNESDGVLFKIRNDPRVTRVGQLLRRYSLDELPQLLNVLRGEMSLVGPRPPLPAEVEQYGADVHRRLVVRPGMTGLWQVSGRSDLSWEESVRLDLRYVDNWSLMLDLQILWKTWSAVTGGKGAY
ncbi:exopolysaccharide biosynthesis polyprenyl glycosylphosphotransferase [Microbispora rosea subsp. aerata]|nr:sugar transferase [Microbispora rosea]GGO17165.1 exopolysaccharide biosynthesis polyprenyl glycosylphosphotransferase [Microbispora rosea subsp. aerata]GIH56483.1 exopolysaccharide biosynthesis polyprenyl glycosylphosphotransferase [Microbispora rosea subsp. aerata]GLJ81988.1 exopolysaccharide biosynthesis polyprenyl glycosylphosphotransferase [Microbispora rosea subsp. aerata]